ncbi:response regulator [Dongia sp.]|uniref:response regulator n=1 Tax=Dongia sp. TaxID=1977262 RepID=UPI0035B30567
MNSVAYARNVEFGRAEANVAAILLAEDDEAVRTFVTRALTHRGHSVVAVSDGQAAIRALEAQTFDLMLTDIVMPGLDGLALAETAGKINPKMTVLMMTGFAAARDRVSQDGGGVAVADVITKPFSLKQICSAVDSALDGQKPAA